MSADDYFMTASYEGKIYKTVNLQDRLLANYCHSDEELAKEQRRIDKEMKDFQDRVFGHDSVAEAKAAAAKAMADSIAAVLYLLNAFSMSLAAHTVSCAARA